MEVLPRDEKLVMAGKHIQVFSNEATRIHSKESESDLIPITAGLNLGQLTFYVMTR